MSANGTTPASLRRRLEAREEEVIEARQSVFNVYLRAWKYLLADAEANLSQRQLSSFRDIVARTVAPIEAEEPIDA